MDQASAQGAVQAEQLVPGFVLLAPNTTYPQHSDDKIGESHIWGAGTWSENDAAIHAPGSLILNRPGFELRITTGELEPCLLAYRPNNMLVSPSMKPSAHWKTQLTQGSRRGIWRLTRHPAAGPSGTPRTAAPRGS
ncbi:dimethylsulfonioproprionate lyase family protein [Paracoccus sp. R86501]|uniref:dimethylsulfonioproprionate lyase family protein n=1 Tax=Paracoccus sp. R86501 TaxID=3101711 RepID=UPI0036709552